MTREEEIFQVFAECNCDKGPVRGYASVYARIPKDIGSMLEIGVDQGYSIRAWRRIFPLVHIVGVDKSKVSDEIKALPHVEIVECDVLCLPNDIADRSYGLIVDDGSHECQDQLEAWKMLYPRLTPGGWYVIEDVKDDSYGPLMGNLPNPEVVVTNPGPYDRVIITRR